MVVVAFAACSKESRNPEWDVDILTPLAKTSLSIQDLVPDSLLRKNSGGTMSIVYKHTLADTLFSDAVKLPDTSMLQSFSLSDMKLATASITKSISLGQIAEKGGITGATIIANHGSMLSIPTMNSTSPNSQNIDGSELFQQAVITQGYMDITITNHFPLDLTDFYYNLTNQSDNSLILQDSFPLLPKNGGSATHTISLAGKKVESSLVGTILKIASPGTGTNLVMIDTAQSCDVHITVRDVKVSSISAVFTNKILVDFNYATKILNDEIQLQFVDLDQASIQLTALSSIPENLKFIISSSRLTKNGQPFQTNFYVNKGSTGNYINTGINLDLSGYKLDLRDGQAFGYNKLSFRIQASVDSSGKVSTITQNDSLKMIFSMKNFNPYRVQGYFGRTNYTIKGTLAHIDLFKKIVYGKFNLKEAKLSVFVENGLGVHGNASVSKLVAYNGTNQVSLVGNILNKPFAIERAKDNPFYPLTSIYEMNENNSNMLDMMQLMPNQMDYQFDLMINPGGNTSRFNDFYYRNSRIKAGLMLEVPLSVGFDLFTLADTVNFSIGTIDKDKRINEGLMKVIIDNGYPYDAFVTIDLLDEYNRVVDKLFVTNNWVKAGVVYSTSPWDCQFTKTTLSENINATRIANLSLVKKAAFKITLNTQKNSIKTIYEPWKINMKLVADFNYRVGGNKK